MSNARRNADDGDVGAPPPDPRGHMHRRQRLMSDVDATELKVQKVAHVGTVDSAGWPYVVPLIYIYEGGDRLYLHTGESPRDVVLRSDTRKVRSARLDLQPRISAARPHHPVRTADRDRDRKAQRGPVALTCRYLSKRNGWLHSEADKAGCPRVSSTIVVQTPNMPLALRLRTARPTLESRDTER